MSIRIIAATVAALGIAGCAPTGTENAGGAKEMKLAFDFTDGDPAVLLTKLNNVDVTREQLIESGDTPKIVMTFRDEASYFTQINLAAVEEADRPAALKVAAKLRERKDAPGMHGLEQRNLPLADRL
jgi:hypothetical protein